MKILVTGATGFLGQHVVPALMARGHEIIATARSLEPVKVFPWSNAVHFYSHDIHADPVTMPECFGEVEALVHLAWQGLPNYKAPFHYETNLPADYRFLKSIVERGVKHLLVTGTCFEYGTQNGCLSEEMPTDPANPYALAKDTLRKFLQMLQSQMPFILQWVRLFYLYGPGQNPNSLLSQLDKAIDRGDALFNMSGGEQLRDYLPIEEVARVLAIMLEHPELAGIINCCSGIPISVRSLVEARLAERGSDMALNLGHYPYPDYEPMAFWGSRNKLYRALRTA
ncbi:NAD-dependent epimerase/dehydratase family protein [Methylococcus mesophilus]|uniref:NAD-dependent epimerase/dehydratase family protein n=1 Tax=Methylococcus mesophilus TaxID=2993564 RepID=UPI00224B5645|nr:NAD(P)-dependent oxidoreductase [Methylococcus mesophilus]UZR28721.1 NAD(P)-dependent oxidoreductase [Methylococcus mesophilus]